MDYLIEVSPQFLIVVEKIYDHPAVDVTTDGRTRLVRWHTPFETHRRHATYNQVSGTPEDVALPLQPVHHVFSPPHVAHVWSGIDHVEIDPDRMLQAERECGYWSNELATLGGSPPPPPTRDLNGKFTTLHRVSMGNVPESCVYWQARVDGQYNDRKDGKSGESDQPRFG
jgi:hypothetical protein